MRLTEAWADIEEAQPAASAGMTLPEILEAVRNFLSRYVVFSNEAQSIAVTLWIAHTLVIKAFDCTPYLHITSPVKRCGKSRLFDLLKLLCAKSWNVVSPSQAVTFRKINQDAPTLLLDEVDTIFSANGDENKEGLRALLNAGFVRGTMVPRCVGPNYALTDFDVFCPKALAGIGKLPDTVADRCIPIVMARRKPGEVIDKFRRRDAEVSARPITVALEAWGKDEAVISMLRAAHPEIPTP